MVMRRNTWHGTNNSSRASWTAAPMAPPRRSRSRSRAEPPPTRTTAGPGGRDRGGARQPRRRRLHPRQRRPRRPRGCVQRLRPPSTHMAGAWRGGEPAAAHVVAAAGGRGSAGVGWGEPADIRRIPTPFYERCGSTSAGKRLRRQKNLLRAARGDNAMRLS